MLINEQQLLVLFTTAQDSLQYDKGFTYDLATRERLVAMITAQQSKELKNVE